MGKVRIRSKYRGRSPQGIAESASVSDGAGLVVTSAGGGASGYANEPAGFTLVARCLCDTLPTNPSSKPAGWTNNWGTTGSDNLAIISGTAPPVNGPDILRIRYPGPGTNPTYPDGFPDGIAPCNFFTAWSTTGGLPEDIGECSEIFIAYTFKVVGDGTDFQNHASGTKFGFFSGPSKNGTSNEFFFLMRGGGGEVTSMQIGLNKQNDAAWTDVSTEAGSSITAGAGAQWHTMEMHGITNTLGSADGVLKIWIDGTLVINETNEVWRTSTYPRKFLDYKMNPTFGGVNGPDKAQDDDIYMADIYISGKL